MSQIQQHIDAANDHVALALQQLLEREPRHGTDCFSGLLEAVAVLLDHIKQSEYDW